MPRTIRARILMAMMLVIGGFFVLVSLRLDDHVSTVLDGELARGLDRARGAYERFAHIRDELRVDKARSIAQDPHLRATLGTPDVDGEAVHSAAEPLLERSGAPLLLVLDDRAQVMADASDATITPVSMAGQSGVAELLTGQPVCRIWDYQHRVFVVAASPIFAEGAVAGALCLGYPLDAAAAEDLRRVTGHDVLLMQGDRFVARSWDPTHLDHETRRELEGPAAWSGELSGISRSGLSRITVAGHEHMATSIGLAGRNTVLVLSRPLDDVLQHTEGVQRLLIISAGAITVLALLVSHLLSRRISRPVQDLTEASRSLADGNLDSRVAVPEGDDMRLLAATFNGMAERMQGLVAAVQEKAEAAEAASEAKSNFLATMSHELRTPMNAVIGFSEILLDSELSGEQSEFVGVIKRSSGNLLELIDGILDLSKIDSGKAELHVSDFNLARLAKEALESIHPIAREKGVRVTQSIAPNAPRELRGDAGKLRQILRNYLMNAAKFTDVGVINLDVSVVTQSEFLVQLRFEVTDTGIGIGSADHAFLFQSFFQVDSSSTRQHGGSGLGLAICKELAELMGGECGVQSQLDQGSTFWFTVDVERARATALLGGPPDIPQTPVRPRSDD